jgi:hypothetical protein
MARLITASGRFGLVDASMSHDVTKDQRKNMYHKSPQPYCLCRDHFIWETTITLYEGNPETRCNGLRSYDCIKFVVVHMYIS